VRCVAWLFQAIERPVVPCPHTMEYSVKSTFRLLTICTTGRLIEPFQRGETPTFTAHVQAGLRALADDPYGLLVFSG
jgi:hypothetical protein